MKLKYYMRGLGIGILLTALILSIGVKKEKLSDKEIIDKATVLGMVMASENELEEMLDATPTPKPSEDTEGVPEVTTSPDSEDNPADAEPVDTEPTDTEPADAETTDTEPADTERIVFTVVKGMSSGMVAMLLEEKGLVEDAEDFNRFIMDAGKASVIRIGTYSLPEATSYQTILDTITK